MTSSWSGSLGDVRAELAAASERAAAAAQLVGLARARVADAIAVLTAMEGQHSEPLLPEQWSRAREQLERVLEQLNAGAMVVADIDARM